MSLILGAQQPVGTVDAKVEEIELSDTRVELAEEEGSFQGIVTLLDQRGELLLSCLHILSSWPKTELAVAPVKAKRSASD
jgi:hypothetical protein